MLAQNLLLQRYGGDFVLQLFEEEASAPDLSEQENCRRQKRIVHTPSKIETVVQ